jgi:hypothetical protein
MTAYTRPSPSADLGADFARTYQRLLRFRCQREEFAPLEQRFRRAVARSDEHDARLCLAMATAHLDFRVDQKRLRDGDFA